MYATLLALVVIAVAGATVEDAGSSWATLYLRDSLGAAGAVAVFGYVALVGSMFIGRLIGDRLVDRFGERTVVRAGGVITAVGMGAALAFPSVPGTIAGFARRGFRSRNTDPGGDASRRPAAWFAPGQRIDGADLADADRLLRRALDRRCRCRRDEPASRVAGGPYCGAGSDRTRRSPQCATPTISIVSTPPTMSAMPAPIIQVRGSSNRKRASTATNATPHADHTP